MLIFGCKTNSPDISGIEVDLRVERFERDIFSLDTSSADPSIQHLINSYGDFFYFYFRDYYTWNFRDSSAAWKDSVVAYVSDPMLRSLNDSVQMKFGELNEMKDELSLALRYYSFYFPEMKAPTVITVINGPGRGAFTYGDSILCIALDDYMDPGFSFYLFQDIPDYLLRRFRPEYIVPNTMQVLSTHQFPFNPAGGKLLDAMIYNGKLMYLKSLVMPDAPDSLITGFSDKDLKWCRDNEKEIWKFFISNDLIYSSDPLEFMKYVTDGPSTSGMPKDAPGNIGSWVGWRIVSAFMKKNEEVTLQQLMIEQDAQKILTQSRYKP